ncbi:MAG: hypothetical protein WAW37_19035 [Syntrophobacteraceae bacterium]
MNGKLFLSLSIVAVVFTLVLGFGALDVAKAVPGMGDEGYTLPPGQTNLFGLDEADNSVATSDRDRADRDFEFPD